MWVCHPDSGFPGEVLGELEFQPFLPPFPSPRERDPSPGWLPHSLPSWCLGCIWACRAPAWCGPALTEQLGRGLGSMRGELALVAGVDLWPVTCGLPAPPGSPSFSLPNEVSASLSVGWTHISPHFGRWAPAIPHIEFLRGPMAPLPPPPEQRCWGQSCSPLWGSPPAQPIAPYSPSSEARD